MSVTAATVRREVLEPGMDARAFNLEQQRLIFNPSIEADSLVELIDTTCPRTIDVVRGLVESNTREGLAELRVVGWADSLATDLRDLELNGAGAKALRAKSIARRLREPLRKIRTGGTPDELVPAFREVHRVLREAPRAQLLAPAVKHELGSASFEILEGLAG